MHLDASGKKLLASLYHQLFVQVYGISIPAGRFYSALQELNLWNPIIRPRYIGQEITFGFEFFVSSPRIIKNMVFHGLEPKQIINVEEKAYPCFWNPQETISKSFPELYSEALELSYLLFKERSSKPMHNTFMGNPIQK